MESFIHALAAQYNHQATYLLDVLHGIQRRYRHIPVDAIATTAEQLNIPSTRVISVIEFYHFFHLQPQGLYQIYISDSITDHMLDKQVLMAYLAEQLQVEPGTTRSDGLVSLYDTSCTGMCDQGPAGLINGLPVTRLSRQKIDQITELITQRRPLNTWSKAFFEVRSNIKKKGLLLNAPLKPGDCLSAAIQRGVLETLSEIEQSGLRGRGGAGFTTAMKWRFCREQLQQERFVICNADEGEPGTFKDRVLLTENAQQVFEGMSLCALIIGAKRGFLYLRAEYLYLYETLQAQLARLREQNFLGVNILGMGYDFDIEIRLGAGAYICGEESALIESLEGKPGIPRNRPPYPVESGYLGKPTVVNNVETFAAAAAIAVYGGSWFAASGTGLSKGSKILSISGDCDKPGIYEYDFGTPVRTILQDCGASSCFGAQIGGPSGTFISEREFDRQIAFEDLATGGSFMVFKPNRNTLKIAQNFTHFFAHESCGFCTPCRVGTILLKKQVDKILDGQGTAGDLLELEKLCRLINSTSHCGLGQTAANPVVSTLQRYPEHYQQVLKDISFQPGFDLDAALATARNLTHRNDPGAHLSQTGEEHG